MAALVEVVNETIAIAEVVVVQIQDLNALNNPRLVEEFFYPPSIFIAPLDIPSLIDDCCPDPYWNAIVFMTNRWATWAGGRIEVSYDDGVTWTKRAEYKDESLVGVVVDDAPGDQNLGTAIPDHWDVFSQVTVEMTTGGFLETKTRDEVLAGANTLYIDGEIRAFSTAVEVTPFDVAPFGIGRTFILTDWMRGMRGTTISDPTLTPDPGSDAIPRALVVDLNGPICRVMMPIGDDELSLKYRARDDSEDFEVASDNQGIEIELTGQNLKPQSVIDPVTTRQSNDNWDIEWIRVSRNPCTQILSARGASDDDTPAVFEARILDAPGGNLVRTITNLVESDSVDMMTYPFPIQILDFGSVQTEIFVEIVRINDWTESDATEV